MHLKLPDRFIHKISDVRDADLLLIMGTSLTVQPFSSLTGMADRKSCRRVLINLEHVGDLGGRPNDLVLLGDCDATVRELCVALGWERELETTWAETALKTKEKSEEEEAAEEVVAETEKSHKEGEKLDQEVNKIAETLEKRLDLSECQTPPVLSKDTSPTTTTTANASSTTEQVAKETEGWKL
ncbi:hypothetical protein C0991_003273 [Blastosporella zonata]|nr:hypothetical protein C0991_003273 [Blastosporella zonata]